MRSLLVSTAPKGNVLENLFVRIINDRNVQDFLCWGHNDGKMSLGSGLFVPRNGCVHEHHFSLRPKETNYQFIPGNYEVKVFASVLDRGKELIKTIKFELDEIQCHFIENGTGKVFLYWDIEREKYLLDSIKMWPPAPDFH